MRIEVTPIMCNSTNCPALGVVCKDSFKKAFIPCPLRSGVLERLVDAELRKRGLAWDFYKFEEKQVCINPDDYPRIYSGDGKHYVPMFPEYETRLVKTLCRRTMAEALAAIKEYDDASK